jgi:hypothetical protein
VAAPACQHERPTASTIACASSASWWSSHGAPQVAPPLRRSCRSCAGGATSSRRARPQATGHSAAPRSARSASTRIPGTMSRRCRGAGLMTASPKSARSTACRTATRSAWPSTLARAISIAVSRVRPSGLAMALARSASACSASSSARAARQRRASSAVVVVMFPPEGILGINAAPRLPHSGQHVR